MRHFRQAIARALIATFLAALTAPALSARHGAAGDDASCGPGLSGGHPTAQFEGVLPPVADDHCALCHWLRAVGGAAPAGTHIQAIALDPLGACVARRQCPVGPSGRAGGSPRAPPQPAS